MITDRVVRSAFSCSDPHQTDELFTQLDRDGDGLLWFKDLYEAELSVWQPFIDENKKHLVVVKGEPEEEEAEEEETAATEATADVAKDEL